MSVSLMRETLPRIYTWQSKTILPLCFLTFCCQTSRGHQMISCYFLLWHERLDSQDKWSERVLLVIHACHWYRFSHQVMMPEEYFESHWLEYCKERPFYEGSSCRKSSESKQTQRQPRKQEAFCLSSINCPRSGRWLSQTEMISCSFSRRSLVMETLG